MTDIIIIGGGIAGLSAAAALAPHATVALFESETVLGYHASGRSAAMFLADYGNETVRALNYASIDHHQNANGGVLSERGMMMIARPQERDDFVNEFSAFGMQEIGLDQAGALVPILHPDNTAFAAYREGVFDLDADRLLQNYTADARRGGVGILTGSPVTGVERTAKTWTVTTANGETRSAPVLVNAAGAWADEIAKLSNINTLGFQPYRRSMARLPAPGGHDVSKWPFMDGVNERWYAKPDAGSWIVSPSEEHPVDPHDAWADDMVLAEGLDRYSEMVCEPVTRLETSWAGLRTFSPDRTLVIGADPADPGFFWLAGQGGYGFQTAPAASTLIAQLILGQPVELDQKTVERLNPARFTNP
jgi:glycine/D-amino acid oxidase-like deaminating enzyme